MICAASVMSSTRRTDTLAAVFIPIVFMGGIVGRLLHEFAVTIIVAILISGVVSITLTPMLCARLLRREEGQRHGAFYRVTERVLHSAAETIYQAAMTRFRPIMMTTMAALMGTLPIAFGTGMGADSRRPLGLCVAGGCYSLSY